MEKKVGTQIISRAMHELAHTLQCDDGVANAACREAALRLDEQTVQIAVLKKQLVEAQRGKVKYLRT